MALLNETTVMIPGPVGQLEVRVGNIEKKNEKQQPLVIVCHPHPLMGGTMDNKVVATVVRAFSSMGFRTLRFNFRGVGQSEGCYAKGIGEAEDTLSILQWAQRYGAEKMPVWLVGFSFGAYVALRVASSVELKQLIMIAPPVHYEEWNTLPHPPCPWLVVQGDQDEVVSPKDVFEWIEAIPSPPQLLKIQGAGHFFHGYLIDLRDKLIRVCSAVL